MDKAITAAGALELFHLNQIAIRAAIEEVSGWVRQRGSIGAHDNVMTALQALDTTSGTIRSAIERLWELKIGVEPAYLTQDNDSDRQKLSS